MKELPVAEKQIQVEHSTPEPAVTQQVDLGSITKLSDSPGCFIRYEGTSGETINWHSSYNGVFDSSLRPWSNC